MRKILITAFLAVLVGAIVLSVACGTKDPLTPEGPTTWERTYSIDYHDYFVGGANDPSGGIASTGLAWVLSVDSTVTPWDSTLDYQLMAMKFTSAGDTIWHKLYGAVGYDLGYRILPAYGGGHVIVGETQNGNSIGPFDILLQKINTGGQLEWSHTYGGSSDEYGYQFSKTPDGGYIIVGYTSSYGAGSYDAYVIKVNAFGTVLWSHTYGTTGYDYAYYVEPVAAGGYLIGGSSDNGGSNMEMFVIKVDDAGTEQWRKIFGIGDYNRCVGVFDLGAEGCFVTGESRTSGVYDFYTAKLDTAGTILWQKTVSQPGNQSSFGARRADGGGVFLFGTDYSSGGGPSQGYLVKVNLNGDLVWQRNFGRAPDSYYLYDVVSSPDGGLFALGAVRRDSTSRYEGYIAKTDANGLLH